MITPFHSKLSLILALKKVLALFIFQRYLGGLESGRTNPREKLISRSLDSRYAK